MTGDAPLRLARVEGEYAVHRLAPDSAIPASIWASPFVSVSRSTDELSIVTDASINIVADANIAGDVQSTVSPWLAYRVAGTLDFAVTGVMSALTAPLADARIGVLAIATYDTDYLLVRTDEGAAAEKAWRMAGIDVP